MLAETNENSKCEFMTQVICEHRNTKIINCNCEIVDFIKFIEKEFRVLPKVTDKTYNHLEIACLFLKLADLEKRQCDLRNPLFIRF